MSLDHKPRCPKYLQRPFLVIVVDLPPSIDASHNVVLDGKADTDRTDSENMSGFLSREGSPTCRKITQVQALHSMSIFYAEGE